MALWGRWFQRKHVDPEPLRELARLIETATGRRVTWEKALEVSAVMGCVRVIADGIAQVPLKLFKASEDGRRREPARQHPLYDILHRSPNPWQTSFEFRETVALHAVLTGNHFSFKNVGVAAGGAVTELLPFEPGTVTVKRAADWSLRYEVRAPNGQTQEFPPAAIWHVRGPSWNAYLGLDAVRLAREAIGLAMATEESQARLHKNGVRPSGVLSVEGTLTEDQYKVYRKWLDENYEGPEHAGRTFIADRKAQWKEVGMSGVSAQHLETRNHQVEDICRHFRVMPIMVGLSDKATTYASAEQMFLAHVVHTLAPWYERLEESIDVRLLTEADRKAGYYAKFIEEGLLRGALKETADFLTKLTTNGVMTRNEARAKLDLNPLDGLDEPLTPANMTVGATPAPVEDPEAPAKAELRAATIAALRREPAAANVTVHPPNVTVHPANVTVSPPQLTAGDVHVTLPEGAVKVATTVEAPQVRAGDVHVEPVTVHMGAGPTRTTTTFKRDRAGELERSDSVTKPLGKE